MEAHQRTEPILNISLSNCTDRHRTKCWSFEWGSI